MSEPAPNSSNNTSYTTEETIMMIDPQNGIVLMNNGLYQALNLVTGAGQRVFVNIQTGEWKLVEFLGMEPDSANGNSSQ